jgi:hypothetical protein
MPNQCLIFFQDEEDCTTEQFTVHFLIFEKVSISRTRVILFLKGYRRLSHWEIRLVSGHHAERDILAVREFSLEQEQPAALQGHGKQLAMKEGVLCDREATEPSSPDHCWV